MTKFSPYSVGNKHIAQRRRQIMQTEWERGGENTGDEH